MRRLSHRLMQELVVDCASRMMSLSSRERLPSHSRSLNASLRLPLCGMRASSRAEQLNLRSQQRIVATVDDSVLQTEMAGLESQEEDDPKRILFFKPMSWLGQIRTHRRDEAWSASLWQTFFAMTMGAQIPVIAESR